MPRPGALRNVRVRGTGRRVPPLPNEEGSRSSGLRTVIGVLRGPVRLKKGLVLGPGYPGGFSTMTQGEVIRYTRFERARIIGARALQISMGAPILLEPPQGLVDPIELAEIEFGKGVLPITVKRG